MKPCPVPGCFLSDADCRQHHDAAEAYRGVERALKPQLLRTAYGGAVLIYDCGECDGTGRVMGFVRHKIHGDYMTSAIDCPDCQFGAVTRQWNSDGIET